MGHHKLLIAERFVATYAKLEPDQLETLKREVNMKWMGNTITEYYTLLGEEQGEKRGIALGEKRGILQGEIRALARLLDEGKIDQAYFDKASASLKADLAKLTRATKAKRTSISENTRARKR